MLEDYCQGTGQHYWTSENLSEVKEMAKHINKEKARPTTLVTWLEKCIKVSSRFSSKKLVLSKKSLMNLRIK